MTLPLESVPKSDIRLTGKTRYRINFRGRLIVQVEEWWWGMPAFSRWVGWNLRWRDADPLDLARLHVPTVRGEGG